MDTTAITTATRRDLPVSLVSALSVLAAAVATEAYGLVVGALGVPMAAGSVAETAASPITVGMFAMGCLVCGFWGTVLAVLFARFARRPARTYLVTTLVLLAVSLVFPLAGIGALSTRVALAFAHLIAAAIIIPAVTRRLARRPERVR